MLIKKVSRLHILMLASLMAHSPSRAVNWENVGAGALFVSAIASVVGLIAWANAPESNERLLERIENDYDGTTPLMTYVEACENSMIIAPYATHEQQLYTFLHVSLNNTNIDNLEDKVREALSDLSSGKKELDERIKKEVRSRSETLYSMEILSKKIAERQERMRATIKSLLDRHGIYFKLVQYYYTLMTHYADEILVLNRYRYDKAQGDMHITSIVSCNKNKRSYPFIRYCEDLVHPQEKLQRFISQLSHVYPEIMQKAQQLLRELEYIRALIVTSPEYTRDMLQKEQDAIRQAQRELAAQQERFQREQERTRNALRVAQVDLAIQQAEFKKEQEKELKKLKKERKKLENALRSTRI